MSKRQEIRNKHRRQQQQQRILVIVMVVIGALLVVSALIYPSLKPIGQITAITPQVFNTTVNNNSLGDPNAPVKFDIWEDFQCPACRSFTLNIEPQIIKQYVETGKVLYTFHNYAFIDSQVGTKESQQAANAAMCAGAQNRFWDMHAMLWANWNGENAGAFNDKRLVAFAETLGLNMTDFNSCFNQNTFKAEIDADFTKGQDMGVTGTPTMFVNGVKVGNGYVPPFSEISAAIDAALAGK